MLKTTKKILKAGALCVALVNSAAASPLDNLKPWGLAALEKAMPAAKAVRFISELGQKLEEQGCITKNWALASAQQSEDFFKLCAECEEAFEEHNIIAPLDFQYIETRLPGLLKQYPKNIPAIITGASFDITLRTAIETLGERAGIAPVDKLKNPYTVCVAGNAKNYKRILRTASLAKSGWLPFANKRCLEYFAEQHNRALNLLAWCGHSYQQFHPKVEFGADLIEEESDQDSAGSDETGSDYGRHVSVNEPVSPGTPKNEKPVTFYT
jgi:hypothetical protein